MNPNGITEETARFENDRTACTRDEKANLLREFLRNESISMEDGAPVNRSKFLYLYGAENSGKQTILREVAKEVFGDSWESKIYLRVDQGQRFPYKLHAHKVESSRKVIFVTSSKISWEKWKDLYPALQTYTFEGVDLVPTAEGYVTVAYSEYFQSNQRRKEEFANDIKEILRDVCQTLQVSENDRVILQERIMNRIRLDWSNQYNLFLRYEVNQENS